MATLSTLTMREVKRKCCNMQRFFDLFFKKFFCLLKYYLSITYHVDFIEKILLILKGHDLCLIRKWSERAKIYNSIGVSNKVFT